MSDDLDVSVVDSVHEVNENQWNNLVEQADLGSVFHRHEWLALVEEYVPECRPLHVVVSKKGNPVGLLPNFAGPIYLPTATRLGNRLPLREVVSVDPGFGGPVVSTSERDCLELLFDALDEETGMGTLYHAIRTNDLGYVRYGKWLAKRGYEPTLVNCRFRITLDEEWPEIKSSMQSGRRRALRQADEEGVEVVERSLDRSAATELYDDYVANVERVGGVPYERPFFEAMLTEFSDRVRVFSAVHDGERVGSYVNILDDEQETVHFYFSALPDEDCFSHHPSEVLHRRGIRWALDNGYRYYDFGATGAHFDETVFQYKSRYGGEAVPTLQWRKGHSRVGWPAFKLGRNVYQKATY
ncbi:GNAT family N-acetyltransferase [Haloarchaeobius litoreus]|uniref:GNAT family N-acetyltransferase n=1 Tax=Haloarchaeobius litoreus TaxID=755306 RepID=A0ABD6DN42_9EURY